MPTLPSSGRCAELLPRFVEAVRMCVGLEAMMSGVADNIPIGFKTAKNVLDVLKASLS
jgi:hypothetical protein